MFEKSESWERFNLLWDEWTCAHAPMPKIGWTVKDSEEYKMDLLSCFRFADDGVSSILYPPRDNRRRFDMSYERNDQEEINRAEMAAINEALSADEQHR